MYAGKLSSKDVTRLFDTDMIAAVLTKTAATVHPPPVKCTDALFESGCLLG